MRILVLVPVAALGGFFASRTLGRYLFVRWAVTQLRDELEAADIGLFEVYEDEDAED